MKTLELNNLPSPVLLVWGLPEDSEQFVCSYNAISYLTKGGMAQVSTPEGNWKLIGKLSELTEEQAKGLVESKNYPCYSLGGDGAYPEFTHNETVYTDYTGDVSDYKDTALESFNSTIESEGCYADNPYGNVEPALEPECCGLQKQYSFEGPSQCCETPVPSDRSIKALLQWHEAQSKTLPANTLIFKRS